MSKFKGHYKVWATDTYSDKPVVECPTLYQDSADRELDQAIAKLERANKHFIGQIIFYPVTGSPIIVRCVVDR